MKRKISILAFMGMMLVLGAIASTASAATALPDVHVTLSTAYPLHYQGSKPNALTALSSASGVTLEGKGVTLLTLIKELTSLGEFTSTFTNVVFPNSTKKCNSIGDVKGVVLVKGTSHYVLGPGGTKKMLFILFLVPEFEIECEGGFAVLIRGSVMGTVNLPGEVETEEVTNVGGKLEGEKGKPKFTEYFNDTGGIEKAKLEGNAGAGFVASAQNVSEELTLEPLESKMSVFLNR